MGINNLPIITASTIQVSHINDIIIALKGDFVGRNSATGAVQAGQSLGTITIPWGTIYGTALNIGGNPINLDLITTTPNRIVSGQTRTTSALGDFIRADGTALTAVIEGATTDLIVVVNGTSVTFSTDVSVTSLVAAPAANNTALVNEPSYAAEDFTKYAGEQKNTLNIDTAGSEWTSRVGQFIAFKVGASSEIAFGYLKSATEIVNCYRGWFFDDNGDPIVRNTLSNNDTLTILSLGWIFAQNTGTTADDTYITPTISGKEPTSPAAGDYWYDVNSNEWMIYSGGNFISSNSTLIGLVVNDTTSCIASRSFDFDNGFQDTLDIDLIVESATQVRTSNANAAINVYGNEFNLGYEPFVWDITADRESGVSETASTVYYLYTTEEGKPKISTEYPQQRDDLKGFYHPYNSWRYAGRALNDSSSDIALALNFELYEQKDVTISETEITSYVASVAFINLDYIPFQLIPKEKEVEIEFLEFILRDILADSGSNKYIVMQCSGNNGSTYRTSSDYQFYPLPAADPVYSTADYVYVGGATDAIYGTINSKIFNMYDDDLQKFIKSYYQYTSNGEYIGRTAHTDLASTNALKFTSVFGSNYDDIKGNFLFKVRLR